MVRIMRKILHSDMNNFYASVECMLNPSLKGKPVAVCGSVEERHGIVLAKNYPAKAFGVKTGDAVWQAKQKCKDIIIVPPHYDEYIKYSKLAREVYNQYTNQVEPYGMDECWLDISGYNSRDPETVAYEIKETMKEELGLTVSVGVSYNKIFAKLGSDMKKPDAVTVIPKDTFREWILNSHTRIRLLLEILSVDGFPTKHSQKITSYSTFLSALLILLDFLSSKHFSATRRFL